MIHSLHIYFGIVFVQIKFQKMYFRCNTKIKAQYFLMTSFVAKHKILFQHKKDKQLNTSIETEIRYFVSFQNSRKCFQCEVISDTIYIGSLPYCQKHAVLKSRFGRLKKYVIVKLVLFQCNLNSFIICIVQDFFMHSRNYLTLN